MFVVISRAAFISLFMLLSHFSQDRGVDAYPEFQRKVNSLEKQGQYRKALQLTRRVFNHYPEREFDLMKELIYLHEKTDQLRLNISLWSEGHEKGYFFLLDSRIKRYKPYLDFEKFHDLAEKDQALRAAALAKAETVYKLVLPENYSPGVSYPLLIIMHGGGSNLVKVQERWELIPEISSDYLICFIQSYRHYDSETFGWSPGDRRTRQDIRNIYDDIVLSCPVDTSRVYLGGTSAGGTMALDLAFCGILPVSGIIAFCPGKPGDLDLSSMKNRYPAIFMLGGEQDHYLPRQKELALLFKDAGIRFTHEIVPGMGHGFPEQYRNVMTRALQFLQETDQVSIRL